MASGTRSSNRNPKADEDNDLKGSKISGKKSVISAAVTSESSGVRRSPRETLSKKNTTPPTPSDTRKSNRLEKQTANLNSTTPQAKRNSERVEKRKQITASPLRRSERGKMPYLVASPVSKRSDKSPDLLKTKGKKETKEKSTKLTTETVEVNKIEVEDEQADETQKKRMDARAYKALFVKQRKRVSVPDRCNDLNETYSRSEEILEEFTERTHERTAVTSTSQSAEEVLKNNNEHKLFPSSPMDSCKNTSSNGGDPQSSKNGLVAEETNDDSEKAAEKNLQSPHLVESIMPGGVLDCDISVEMVQKAMPPENKGHGISVDPVALPKMSSNDIGTCTGAGTSLSSGCKRKDQKAMPPENKGHDISVDPVASQKMSSNDIGTCTGAGTSLSSGCKRKDQKAMPPENKGHDISVDPVASPKMSSNDIGTCTGAGTSLSSGCKRKDQKAMPLENKSHDISVDPVASPKMSCNDIVTCSGAGTSLSSGCKIKDQKAMPPENKGHDVSVDLVASPKMSSNDIGTCTGAGTSLSSGCKRKDCTETCGTCSKKQRVDCNLTEQGLSSSNIELNQLFGSSDVKDKGKLDVGINTGHVEKSCNYIQEHMSSADLQTSFHRNTCIICRLDGKLLRCYGKGCQRSYHLSCLEPPHDEFPPGAWYCLLCVRKKLESGIYSVSEGIEAIWDSRELEASENGLRRHKQYFVKYRGLAHVHNCWVPENQVLLEAPSLVARYNRKNQGAVWKKHWAVPQRLLLKRLLTIPKECDENHTKEHGDDKLNCHVEWLVKWCGLGYEHASWELENASFISCPEGQRLIREYETRKKAQRASKFDKERAVVSLGVSQLPAAVSSGLEASHDAVNKLSNYWCRGQNAIIVDDQERISNVISSILAFPFDISRPFLIISTPTSQYSWDEEFLRLSPSAHIVVYGGSKEIRNSIRNLEFYDEGGCIMFQVLITSPEVMSEDSNMLDCIGWEAIIVDECQRPRIASCFEQIKTFGASKRLLIISSQLKDNVAEYLNLLSLLDSQRDSNGSESLVMNSSDNIDTLKERLAKYVAYERKLESSRFLEYWVPVLLSNVQIEKYCFTLLSNSLSLCSPSKTDRFGVLRGILTSSRKCCDHPYDVDESLQMLLTKGLQPVEFLDIGINASGKLQLLDAMLWEIKKQELKVLILFQYVGGSGRDVMGDILDDFLRQRFGIDSYERVDNGVIPSKKQCALNRFNNERERFVFLLETRACLSSIKLSAVGAVIIFGSDWSPMNDLRALQKITLDSQSEKIKVFRLYSSFTMEEKLLMLSKQDKTVDINIENISPSSCHMLLKWGASYLFSQLDKFHGITTLDECTSSEQSHLKDVIQDFFTILHQTGIDGDANKLSLILQAKQNRGTYRTEVPLFGEQKFDVMDEDPSHTFWTKLLEGKTPRWKYSTASSQRNRKRVQTFDDLQKQTEPEKTEVAKRRKKFVSDGSDHPSPKAVLQEGKLAAGDREGNGQGTSSYDFTPLSKSVASGSDRIHTTSNSFHLANNISKIPAFNMAEWESRRKQCDSQKNLHVILRPQITELCKVLHLTEDVKAMVERFLEYILNNHLVSREPATILQAFQISLCWSAASFLKQKLDHKESLALAKQHLGFTCKREEADYVYSMLRCLKRMFLYRTGAGQLKVPNSPKGSGLAPEIHLAQRDLLKSIKEIEKKCDKLIGKLAEKHNEEIEEYNCKYEEEKAQLENMKRTEAAVIRLHSNVSMRTDKLKNLDTEYARKFDELKQQRDLHHKNCEALQVTARSNILERKARWVESVKAWAQVELVKPPVSYKISDGSKVNMSDHDTVSLTEALENNESVGFREGQKNLSSLLAPSADIFSDINTLRNADGKVPLIRETMVANFDENQENLVSAEAPSSPEIPAGAVLCNFDGKAHLRAPETVSSGEGYENLHSLVVPSSEGVPGGTTLNMTDGELPLGRPKAVCSTEGQGTIIPGGSTLNVPDEEISKSTPAIVTSCEDTIVCTNPSTSKEPETAPSEVLQDGRVQRVNGRTSHMENDQQDGILCTMNMESEFPGLLQADLFSLQPAPTLDQDGPPPPDLVAETSPLNDAIDVTCNVSNPDATVVEVREQMQQPRCSESISNLPPSNQPSVSAIEHQSNNEGQTSNQSSQTPGQSVANHIELSNQDVLRPLRSPIDSAVNGLVRHASETRTASVPSVSNGLPLQTARTVSSRMPPTLYRDPLQSEMERILKEKEQTSKVHEDVKLQLQLECEKEIEEVVVQIRRKYQVKLKEKEAEFLLQKKELDVNYNKVLKNKILAEAFRCKCVDKRASGSTKAKQGTNSSFMQALGQLSSQQMVRQPSMTSGIPSTGSAYSMETVSPAVVDAQTMNPSLQPSTASGIPSTGSASSMQTVSLAVVNAQTMGPPLQVVNPSAVFSDTPTRPPHIGVISYSTGNLQIGTEIRAPAPHLQTFRPSSSVSLSTLPLLSHGMPSQPTHYNHAGASMSLRQSYVNHLAHKQASTTGQPDRIQHEVAGGLIAPHDSSLHSLDVLMGVNNPSGANENPPAFMLPDVSSRMATLLNQDSHVPSGCINSVHQSERETVVVCLSDDD